MPDALNLYGDTLVQTTGQHGADIASQRMDNLDVETLLYALRLNERSGAALDLGCGFGTQGLRLASLGFNTTLIDLLPIELTVLRVSGLDNLLPISYLQRDLRLLQPVELPSEVSICYSQRFIHYLEYDEALTLLKVIHGRMKPAAKLFLSASGLDSELGADYRDSTKALLHRFAHLSAAMAEKHNIKEAVCLYRPDDLVNLCRSASFTCDGIESSSFGNVKGIFTAS